MPSTGAPDCGVDVDPGDVVGLRAAFDDAAGAPGTCDAWEVRISGTYVVTPAAGPLLHVHPAALHVIGPAGGTARIEAGDLGDEDGTRLIDARVGGPITLERVVLADGRVEGLEPAPGVMDPLIEFGGAIVGGFVELIDSEVVGNSAVKGGAVYADEVRAERTSFIGNIALDGVNRGGAIRAEERVTLVNVTFTGNIAAEGGAVWLPADATLDATFVTFLGNQATDANGGADVHRAPAVGDGAVSLRGVLFGGVVGGSAGASCGGEALDAAGTGLTVVGSFEVVDDVLDASCAEVAPLAAPLPFTTVPFLTGTSALQVPDGGPAAIGEVACDGGWPAVDQRGVARPQGDTCDAGAVEREVVIDPPPPPPVPPAPGSEPEPEPDEVVGGPVPTSVPAGDGACADGCPAFGRR